MTRIATLLDHLRAAFGEPLRTRVALGEVTAEIDAAAYRDACLTLRDDPRLRLSSVSISPASTT